MYKILLAISFVSIGFMGNAQTKDSSVEIKSNSKSEKRKVKIVKEIDGKIEVIEKELAPDEKINVEANDKKQTTTVTVSEDGASKGKQKIRIEKNENGKVTVTEKIIDATPGDYKINTEEPDTTIKGNRKRIYITENIITEDFDDYGPSNERYSRQSHRNAQDIGRDIDVQIDRFNDKISDIPYRIRKMRPYLYDQKGNEVFKEKGIKALQVYTNKPDVSIINIRFFAPEEGDVKIIIIDANGGVVEKSEIKKFKGEYVGQLNTKKSLKGIYFVIVSQGDDASSKKLKIGIED